MFHVKYVNPLLYPFSVGNFPSPESVVLGIYFDDLTSKISLLLFTQISDREQLKIIILSHITSS